MEGKPRSVLGLVFLTVFLDIVGFSILFPLFPQLLEHYLARESGGLIGRLNGHLQEFAGGDANAVAALFGGILGSLYSTLQFLFAPAWGALSDRIGRRPTLLFTLTGTVAGYVLWVFAGSFALLLVSRALCGIMAGNISTASAAVADTTSGRQRAAGMGVVGMAIGLGFVLGPALGALAMELPAIHGDTPSPATLALNPFSTAALVSALLALTNLVSVAARFPETLSAENRAPLAHTRNPLGALRRLSFPGVARTNVVYLLFLTAFSAMEFTLTFLAAERFDYDHVRIALMFTFVGVVIALVQGGIVRRAAPRLGEKRLAIAGLALCVPGFLVVGLATRESVLYPGLFLMSVGSALAIPCLGSLVSRYTPSDRQGASLGVFRSLGALSRAVGPLVGGLLYFRFGSAAPYAAGGAFLCLPLLLAAGLPPVPSAEVPGEAPA